MTSWRAARTAAAVACAVWVTGLGCDQPVADAEAGAGAAAMAATQPEADWKGPTDFRGTMNLLREFEGAEAFFQEWLDMGMPEFPPDADMVPLVSGSTYLRYAANALEADAIGVTSRVPPAVARQIVELLIAAEGGDWIVGWGETNCFAAAAVDDPDGDGWLLTATSEDWESAMGMICRLRRSITLALPAALGEWSRAGEPERFDASGAIEVADPQLGGSTQGLAQVEYFRGDEAAQVSVYDMGSSEAACGALSRAGVGEPDWAGQGCFVSPRQVQFWQGPYYVVIRTLRREAGVEEGLLQMARDLARSLGPEGPLPEAAVALGARADGIQNLRICESPTDLSGFVRPQVVEALQWTDGASGAAHQVEQGDPPTIALAVLYPDGDSLAAAAESLAGQLTGGAMDQPIERAPRRFCVVRAVEDENLYLLLAVLDATGADEAQTIVEGLGPRG